MASLRQEYFILRSDIPIAKANNLFKKLLNTQNADHVRKGELLMKKSQSDGSGRSMYSLPLDKSKMVSCGSSDVVPISEEDFEWLVAIKSTMDRHQVYVQRDKFEAVKKMKVGDKVWVSLPISGGTSSTLPAPSCCQGTVRYIGPIKGMPGRHAGVELKEKRGSSDGTFRKTRYFVCQDDYGTFLPANQILAVPNSSSGPPVGTGTHKTRLLSAERSKSDRNFYLDDAVVVFDNDGRRVPGVVKWTVPGINCEKDGYIIGIETVAPVKRELVREHISGLDHHFTKPDCRKHTYLAVPEVSVMKEGEGTPGNLLSEAMDVSNPLTNSVLAVASGIAAESNCSTTHVINEQAQALQETEAKKKKADNEKLAASFGMNPEEFKVQQEQYRKLESENEQRFEPYPGTISLGANGDGHHYIASGQGDEGMQEYYRSSGVNRGWIPSSRSSTYEENQSVKVVPLHQRVQNLEVGDTVELVDPPVYGTIRWIGKFPGLNQDIAGVELDARMNGGGDGSWKGEHYFTCTDGHAVFIALSKLKPDPRFVQQPQGSNPVADSLKGKPQMVRLDKAPAVEDLKLHHFIGRMKGIQGHQNSCYLDATLFAMFGLTNKFDEVLYGKPKDDTAKSILQTMCEEIIFPLRSYGVICYNPVMKLREALDKLNRVKGLTHAEQDPEEFLNLLFKHVLSLKDPFIKLQRPSGLDTEFFFQLFLEPSDQKKWTVGEMLRKSMEDQRITFAQAPRRVIIQLPRYGKAYKVFETVYPEVELDISDLCFEYVPPNTKCAMCGWNPTHCCRECGRHDPTFQSGVVHYFCELCVRSAHRHPGRLDHSPEGIAKEKHSCPVTLDLMSVVCIEKSHYVCFTRLEDSWVFFDSMADRTDDQYNIPEITECPAVGEALKHIAIVKEKDPTTLDPLVRRLVRDASLCFYAATKL